MRVVSDVSSELHWAAHVRRSDAGGCLETGLGCGFDRTPQPRRVPTAVFRDGWLRRAAQTVAVLSGRREIA